MVPPKHHKYESRKKNHNDMILSVLKTQRIQTPKGKPKTLCAGCRLNCTVARNADQRHWANQEGSDPVYGITSCPKEEKPVIKIRGREK